MPAYFSFLGYTLLPKLKPGPFVLRLAHGVKALTRNAEEHGDPLPELPKPEADRITFARRVRAIIDEETVPEGFEFGTEYAVLEKKPFTLRSPLVADGIFVSVRARRHAGIRERRSCLVKLN